MREADPIFEMYIHESTQMIESTEAIILDCEHIAALHHDAIHEIFRNMHTLKGSSAMIGFHDIANVAHVIEDLFHMLRENEQLTYNFQELSNIILQGVDYFKQAISHIASQEEPSANSDSDISSSIIAHFNTFIEQLQQPSQTNSFETPPEIITTYQSKLRFTEDCQMENIRAYQSVHHLEPYISNVHHLPENLIEDESSSVYIREHGFQLTFQSTLPLHALEEHMQKTAYLATIELEIIEMKQLNATTHCDNEPYLPLPDQSSGSTPYTATQEPVDLEASSMQASPAQMSVKSSVISVNVQKLDRLMDLVGELVIAETMLSNENEHLNDRNESSLTTFTSQRSQLKKITSELQDTIMSIRMVPLAPVFHRMRRLTRDMSQKLNKDIQIDLIGEDTEIDKSVIDQISDPLMHIVRNAIDHGIENKDARLAAGKLTTGKVTLEARNIGSDVLLMISDDGQGLNKQKLIQKAIHAGLLSQEQSTIQDRDAYQLIFHPGLSTKEEITEFSGRGVGMDVVAKNIEAIGGTIHIDSEQGKGTVISIKIPLTLAIIDGMNVTIGDSYYTLPTTSIKESFRPHRSSILQDPDGNQMVMVRGECYSIIKLSSYLNQQGKFHNPTDGILVMLEHESKTICLQVDELVGQQQVVIKPLPHYFKRYKRLNVFSGCTLLGNGNISMILNMAELVSGQATVALT